MKKVCVFLFKILCFLCVCFTFYFFLSPPEKRLEIALFKTIGSSKDVFFMKRHFGVGEFEKTALIFGYTDDFGVCNQLIADHYKNYPDTVHDAFLCQHVN